MRLADAIRRGSVGTQKSFGLGDLTTRTCALGAAGMTIGLSRVIGFYDGIVSEWPILLRTDIELPVKFLAPSPGLKFYQQIYILNDSLGWSRQRIADWVEQIEIEHENKEKAKNNNAVQEMVRTTEVALQKVA